MVFYGSLVKSVSLRGSFFAGGLLLWDIENPIPTKHGGYSACTVMIGNNDSPK